MIGDRQRRRRVSALALAPGPRRKYRRATTLSVVLAASVSVIASCDEEPTRASPPDDDPAQVSDCGPFGDWQTSPYVLPYSVGESFVVSQANCSGFGHSGFWRFGYDFIMDIGTVVTAARSGVVTIAQDGTEDGDPTGTNLITVRHDDGTVALYSHLTLGGVLVRGGQRVQAGDTIGLSGNTGNTGGLPHLHFSVHPCNQLPGLPGVGDCPTQPVNFRNTDPNPRGLMARERYLALPFD